MTSIPSNTTSLVSSDSSYDILFPNLSNAIIPKNSLFDDIKKNKCIQMIINEITKIPDIGKYRTDLELIKFCVNLAENLFIEKKSGKIKKDIVLAVFQKLFSLNPPEQKLISDAIEFLSNNHKIKKLSVLKRYLIPFSKWFVKNFL
jgi:hypothetical protein